MTRREQLLLDIEAATIRLAWVQRQIAGGRETPALKKYLLAAKLELQALRARYLKTYQGDIQ